MKYDLENIFTLVKHDEQWIQKLIIGSLFIVAMIVLFVIPFISLAVVPIASLPLFIICLFAAAIIGLGLYGYFFKTAQDYMNNPQTKLPQWSDFFSFVLIGLKGALGSIMYNLPFIIFNLVIVGFLLIFKADNSKIFEVATHMVDVVMQLFYIAYSLIYLVLEAVFIKKGFNPFQFLNFSEGYKMIKNNFIEYLILVVLYIAISTVLVACSFILFITIVGIVLIPFVIMYACIISFVITARFIQITDEQKSLQKN